MLKRTLERRKDLMVNEKMKKNIEEENYSKDLTNQIKPSNEE